MGIKSNRQNLINNIIEFIKIYNFDGFDCDWEPSWIDDKVQMEAINNSITYYYLTFIQEFRKQWMNMDPTAIAFPRSCNGMSKWKSSNGVFEKGTPMHVKGALMYNFQVQQKKLDKKYPLILDGEKIKFVHLKNPNPYQCNAFTFITECPSELDIVKYVDYEKQFEKSYVEPLKFITNAIHWHIDDTYGTQATLMDFFS